MSMQSILVTAAIVVGALILYDLAVKPMILRNAYEEDFDSLVGV